MATPAEGGADRPLSVETVPAEATWPLRLAVLRPGGSPESARFPDDEAPGALHLAALRCGTVVGVASIHPEPHPELAAGPALRLRGMATSPAERRRGVGSALLRACLAEAAARGAAMLWCNARSSARGFYARHGFEAWGDEFDVSGIGPHVRMHRCLEGHAGG